MTDTLVEPESIPTLDEVNFEDLHGNIGKIRRSASGVSSGANHVDLAWAGGVAMHYALPHGLFLSEKFLPLKRNGGAVAKECQTAADALQDYASSGAPIKQALGRLKRDAEDLVAKARPLGEDWRSKKELVEENDRIQTGVRNKIRDHDEAVKHAVDKIHATNDGPTTNGFEQFRQYGGFLGYGTTAYSAMMDSHASVRYGRFRPRGPDGKYITLKDKNFWQRTRLAMDNKNWQAKAYHSATRQKFLKLGKFGGPIGVGLTAVTSGVSQWGKDSQDPDMSTGKKVTRTGAKATGTAGGAWAGAEAGATIGTGIGAACGGVGAPIGAAVGGLIGAAAGAGIGSKIADGFNSLIGD